MEDTILSGVRPGTAASRSSGSTKKDREKAMRKIRSYYTNDAIGMANASEGDKWKKPNHRSKLYSQAVEKSYQSWFDPD